MPILLSLTYLNPSFVYILIDSLCAVREHSYQLLNNLGYSIGARHADGFPKKEHTHITNVNFIMEPISS